MSDASATADLNEAPATNTNTRDDPAPHRIVIVGGGAAGLELVTGLVTHWASDGPLRSRWSRERARTYGNPYCMRWPPEAWIRMSMS